MVHISLSLSVGQLSRSSMALLLDVNPYLQCQKLGIKVSMSPVRHPLCQKLTTIHSVLSTDHLSSVLQAVNVSILASVCYTAVRPAVQTLQIQEVQT